MPEPLTTLGLLAAAGYLAGRGFEYFGQRGQQQILREQIAAQLKGAETEAEATRRLTREEEKRAKKYTESLLRERREERISEREERLMQSYLASQDRQMALVLQAIQGITQTPYAPGVSPGVSPGGGMMGLLRSNI